jgi:methylmalonyl-CoA mutase C-terminal domain/subunit
MGRRKDQVAEEKIRVLVAKPGLDGHDRGAKVVARALRDAGMEVIYTGIRQTPEMIVKAALQEDVDVLGLSILSGAHTELFPIIMDQLKQKGMENILVVAGGIIPKEDIPAMEKIGIKAIFGPGTTTGDIADYINKAMAERKN